MDTLINVDWDQIIEEDATTHESLKRFREKVSKVVIETGARVASKGKSGKTKAITKNLNVNITERKR